MGGSTPTSDPSPGDAAPCPPRVIAILPDPGGIDVGDAVNVVFEAGPPARAIVITLGGIRLGAVSGVPNLSRLLECLREGVAYNARVDRKDAGALTCLLTLAPG